MPQFTPREYGIWIPGQDPGWLQFSHGEIFHTTSIAMAIAQLKLCDLPHVLVRAFSASNKERNGRVMSRGLYTSL